MFAVCHRYLQNYLRTGLKSQVKIRYQNYAAGYGTADDPYFEEQPELASGSTSVTIINDEQEDALYFDSYSSHGFRFNNGMRVMGPCAVFPRSLLSWNVRDATEITEQSLALFTVLVPKLDIIVIGVGDKIARDNFDEFPIVRYLRSKRIMTEILTTEKALTTFNFLNSEQRYVAGVFIPPEYIEELGDDEIYETASKRTHETLDFKIAGIDNMGMEGYEDHGVRELDGCDRPLMEGFKEAYEKYMANKVPTEDSLRKFMNEQKEKEKEKEESRSNPNPMQETIRKFLTEEKDKEDKGDTSKT